MAKLSTKAIQNQLVQLGESLGFRAVIEYQFEQIKGMYSPRYDVVWFLNVEELKINTIPYLNLVDKHFLPFAAFEVEGSTTSSKNQLGNLANLQLSPCYFNFMVVNNAAAAKENDTYRRGIKIVRSMQKIMGERPLFFFDISMLETSDEFERTTILNLTPAEIFNGRIKGSGGEKLSIEVAGNLMSSLSKTRLLLENDRSPDYFKWAYHIDQKYQQIKAPMKADYLLKKRYTKSPELMLNSEVKSARDYYYIPKIDIAAGFNIQGGFVQFLRYLAHQMKDDVVHFPLLQYLLDTNTSTMYFPLLGIEIEIKESKHALGGMMNLANFHYVGWLVSPKNMHSYVETYKYHLGMKNVHHRGVEDYLL